MYETMPNRNIVYSPLPTRHYVRIGGSTNTAPAASAVKLRNQAWWNLIWLAYPEVDEVFKVVDEPSYEAYQAVTHPKIMGDYSFIRSLIGDMGKMRTISLSDAAKVLQPREFMAYLESLPYMRTKYFQKKGGAQFEIMRQRAELAETGKIYLMNPPKGVKAIVTDTTEYEKVIQPSIDARISWLKNATLLLGNHIRASGFEMPDVKLEIDRFLFSREGACYKSINGEPSRIVISPRQIDRPYLLNTLLHELIHAMDNLEHGHGKGFVEMANRLGYDCKGMYTDPTQDLLGVFGEIRQQLGLYPHFTVEFR